MIYILYKRIIQHNIRPDRPFMRDGFIMRLLILQNYQQDANSNLLKDPLKQSTKQFRTYHVDICKFCSKTRTLLIVQNRFL